MLIHTYIYIYIYTHIIYIIYILLDTYLYFRSTLPSSLGIADNQGSGIHFGLVCCHAATIYGSEVISCSSTCAWRDLSGHHDPVGEARVASTCHEAGVKGSIVIASVNCVGWTWGGVGWWMLWVGGQEKLPSSESSVRHSKIRSDFVLTCFLYARFASWKSSCRCLWHLEILEVWLLDLCIWFWMYTHWLTFFLYCFISSRSRC